MAGKSVHMSLTGASVYSIADLEGLPLIRRRQRASAPLKSVLLAAAALLVVLVTVGVVCLIVRLCLVQQQLTTVNRELTSAASRLDSIERELKRKQNADKKQTLPEASHRRLENATSSSLQMMLERLSSERDNKRQHRVGKRAVSSKSYGASRWRRSSAPGAARKAKSDKFERQLRLVWKHFKDLQNDVTSLRNDVAHPSAMLVLPEDRQHTSNDDHSYNAPNAMQWKVKYNSLFDARDPTNLVVKTAGTYFIYLQITYKGQTKVSNPTCSHMVMLQNPTYRSRDGPLLYGSRTQYGLGQPIILPADGRNVMPIDTLHLSGVFHLTVGDKISVETDRSSRDCIVSSFKDQTFFGAFRLQAATNDYR